MISDFTTKRLRLKRKRIDDFGWEKQEQKAFENTKNGSCAKPLNQPYSLTKMKQ